MRSSKRKAIRPRRFFLADLYSKVLRRLPGWLRIQFHRLRDKDWFYRVINVNRRIKEADVPVKPGVETTINRIVDDLRQQGIAFCNATELISAESYRRLREYFYQKLNEAKSQPGYESIGHNEKSFILPLQVYLDLTNEDPLSEVVTTPVFSAVASRYMGIVPRLQGIRLWHTRPVPGAQERKGSQNWHKDYNDTKFLKVFFYFNDITEDNGPFEFIKETHKEGRFGHLYAKTTAVNGAKYAPSELTKLHKELDDLQVSCTASAGTIIFADTYGFHRGGFCKSGQRDIMLLHFNSNANISQHEYGFAPGYKPPESAFMQSVLGYPK